MHRFVSSVSIFILSLIIFPIAVFGQTIFNGEGETKISFDLPTYMNDRLVDSIEIDNRNIFDTDSAGFNHFVFRLANRLHIITRDAVIRRELLFRVGESCSILRVEETARNLRNRLQLYDAWIEVDTLNNGHLLMKVVTIDEWTLAAGPSFSRDGNENIVSLSISDRNILGRNEFLSLGYVIQDIDDDYFDGRFIDQRFWRGQVVLDAMYSDNPVEKLRLLKIYRPYYDLEQSLTWEVIWGAARSRIDIYHDTEPIGQSRAESDLLGLSVGWRTGSYFDQLLFDLRYAYLFERVIGADTLSNDPLDAELVAAALPRDSIYHLASAGVTATHLDFTKLSRIDGIGNTEDFALGQTVAFSVSRAFQPRLRTHIWDKLTGCLSLGYQFGNSLTYLSYSREMWFDGGGYLRRLTNLSVYGFSYPVRFITFAFHGQYLSDWRNDNAEPLTLGGISGIRGYDKYFRTGNRRAVFNAEIRCFPDFDFLSLVFSPALFMDAGRTWKVREEIGLRDFYFSGGIGLRFAIGHSSRDRVIRLDLAHSGRLGWQISVGTEHYFMASDASLLLTTH
ncbi:MAG: hypothetical protein KOO62_00065 [candidate division Zixibacteria bacterium]|nr:hypothetical protein [candidate division Zixibacteria bacterium]